MSANPNHLSLLKTPSKKRTRDPGDDIHSAKRRRSSISLGIVLKTELASASDSNIVQIDSSRDRFLPALTTTEPFYHLNETSPRSSRLARALGFIQPRLLSFRDDNPAPFLAHRLSDPTLPMRTHLSQSLTMANSTPQSTYSAAKHAKIKPDRVLDSGPMDDIAPHPCAWSSKNTIAAVIRGCVFTHNMETNSVLSLTDYINAACVEWTSDTTLAVGYEWGGICLFNADTRKFQKFLIPSTTTMYTGKQDSEVVALCWSKEQGVLAVGRGSGEVSYFDPRAAKEVRSDSGNVAHPVLGTKWSPDGLFLASGHRGGVVRCMDWRANKTYELKVPHGKRAHKGTVKALAWAPWNPHLLATGNHTVRIWSVSGPETSSSASSGPLHTIPFSSSVSSLHFSPHTTELLSTHGAPFSTTSSTHSIHSHSRRRSTSTVHSSSTALPRLPKTHHALLVHAYPSLQRVHTVPDAHAGPIVDSVLAPDGTRVMTFGEDETLRVFTVWGTRKEGKGKGAIDRYGIR